VDLVIVILQTIGLITMGLLFFLVGKHQGYRSGWSEGFDYGFVCCRKELKAIYGIGGDTNDNNLFSEREQRWKI
jgi:hypothetical protein